MRTSYSRVGVQLTSRFLALRPRTGLNLIPPWDTLSRLISIMHRVRQLLLLAAWAFCLGSLIQPFAQAPGFSGKISGGFQTPATEDAGGRRSVLKGQDARPLGDRVYEITSPRVTMFKPDDTLELVIEAPICLFDQTRNVAYSDSSLSLKTADGKFSIQGVGWIWRPEESRLVISNQVVSFVDKGAVANASTNFLAAPAGATNDLVRITSDWFTYLGNSASFNDNVFVQDGLDQLTCDKLKIQFQEPGGLQKIEAIGNVSVLQRETEVRSGHAVYDLADNLIRITEDPQWRSGSREGSADLLLINRSNQTLFAEGKVYMKLPVTNVVDGATNNPARGTNTFIEILSDRFTYTEAPDTNTPARAVYEGQVRAEHPQGEIRCELLNVHFSPGENRLQKITAERNVEITTRGNKAFGELGVYDLAEEKITLTGDPHWAVEDKTGRSDRLVFFPKSDELLALGNVEMNLPSSSQMDLFAPPGAANSTPVNTTNAPIKIHSPMFSHQGNIAVFGDRVRVFDDRGELRCRLVTVVTGVSNQVQRIIAEGDVQIEQPGMFATGDRATYELSDGKVRLTGGPPRITTPERSVTADMFVIDRDENTFAATGNYRITMKREAASEFNLGRKEP